MRFSIPADHPALAGHFPGRPIVPAVVIMDEVLAAAALREPARAVTGVLQAKFTAILLPGEACTVTFTPAGGGLRFSCSAAGKTVASGLLDLSPGAP